MHDSDRRMNHSFEISSNALARSLLSASHMLILPHSETLKKKKKKKKKKKIRIIRILKVIHKNVAIGSPKENYY